jgi:hypothetical protein
MEMYDCPEILSEKMFYVVDAYIRGGVISKAQMPTYVDFKVEGYSDILRLEIRPFSRFVVRGKGQKKDEFIAWGKSEFKYYDSENAMMKLKSKVVEINTNLPENVVEVFKKGKSGSAWNQFVSWLSSPALYDMEPTEKSTVYFPKSMFDAMRFKMERDDITLKVMIREALDAYL